MIGSSKRPPLILFPFNKRLVSYIGTQSRYVIDEEGNVYSRLKPTVTGRFTKRTNYNLRIGGKLRRYTVEEINLILKSK